MQALEHAATLLSDADAPAGFSGHVESLLQDAQQASSPAAHVAVVRLNEAVDALSVNEARALLGTPALHQCEARLLEVTERVLAQEPAHGEPALPQAGTAAAAHGSAASNAPAPTELRGRLTRLWTALTHRAHAPHHRRRAPELVRRLTGQAGQDGQDGRRPPDKAGLRAATPVAAPLPAPTPAAAPAPAPAPAPTQAQVPAPHAPVDLRTLRLVGQPKTPPRSLSPAEGAKRHPLSPPQLQACQLHEHFATLHGDHGAYAMGRAQLRGSFGKLHYGMALHGNGRALAIKEMRLMPKPGVDRLWHAGKTAPSNPTQVQTEYDVHRKLRQAVNAQLLPTFAQLIPDGEALWRRWVPAYAPSEVMDCIFDFLHHSKGGLLAPKAYIVSSLASGDLGELLANLDAAPLTRASLALRRSLARSFAWQSFAELHVLHTSAKHAHLDLKLENIHVSEGGAFYLADMGLALPIDGKGDTGLLGKRGGIAAPEMVDNGVLGVPEAQPTLCSRSDVFALAATTLQVLAGTNVLSPFEWVRTPQRNEVDEAATAHNLATFFRAAASLPRDLRGRPTLVRNGRDRLTMAASGVPIVDEFMQLACSRDPELTECMLQLALTYRPSLRGDALALAHASARLVAALPTNAAARLTTFFAVETENRQRVAQLAELRRYVAAVQAAPLAGTAGAVRAAAAAGEVGTLTAQRAAAM